MRKLLGIEGPKGSGKDTVCKLIHESCPVDNKRFAFADVLKQELHDEMGLDLGILHGTQEDKDTTYTKYEWEHPRFDQFRTEGKSGRITYREMMTIWGAMKGCEYWINKILPDLYDFWDRYDDGLAIITDVRFPGEAEMVKDLGGSLLFIDGVKTGKFNDHVSEAGGLQYDYTIKGKGKASIGQTKSSLIDVMWSAFGINIKGRINDEEASLSAAI